MSLPGTIEEFKECGFAVPKSEGGDQLKNVSGLKETLIVFVGCLMSHQHDSVSQVRICSYSSTT